jgi:hypothetical protein
MPALSGAGCLRQLRGRSRLHVELRAPYQALAHIRKEGRQAPHQEDPLEDVETAQGNDRAALGLAGVAVQAGARSPLGTLWSVNGAATSELLTDFYRELRNEPVSKAVALQHAQQRLIADRSYGHPFYWSPFLLISNWL